MVDGQWAVGNEGNVSHASVFIVRCPLPIVP